jgi:Zn-dependent peptidase ImmA (M78 family)
MQDEFQGEKLHLARLFQGLSLQDLGDKTFVTKQFVQMLESGKKSPNEDLEKALAQVLEVRRDFFHKNLVTAVTEDKCHFRKLKTTPVSVRVQALYHAALFSNIVGYLEEHVSFPESNFPQQERENLTVENIELASENCRKEWKLGLDTPITNMTRVLENAGAIVTQFSDISEKIDAFSMDIKRPLVIRNPAKESSCRARFDLAHECGHLVMHSGQETGDTKTENEAYRFAGAFLLPRVAFLKEFSFLRSSTRIAWEKLYKLKLRWKVSVAAIMRRASDLNMIDALRYRTANIYLNRSGQSKIEKFDREISIEEPEALRRAIEVLAVNDKTILLNLLGDFGIEWKFFKRIVGNLKFEKDFGFLENSGNLVSYSGAQARLSRSPFISA